MDEAATAQLLFLTLLVPMPVWIGGIFRVFPQFVPVDLARVIPRARHVRGNPGCFVHVCFEVYDGHCEGQEVRVALLLQPVLLANAPWIPEA